MKILLTALASLLLLSSAAIAADKPKITDMTITDIRLEPPPILVVLLYAGDDIPAGYIDSTTRPDATNICNALIATQSKLYATPVSKSRCIIKVQSDRYDNP